MREVWGVVGAAGLAAELAAPAAGFEALEGYFIALVECDAFQSKNKATNPGEVMTEALRAYPMRGINAPGGDFFQMRVAGAPVTEDRWVHVSCGLHVVAAGTEVADPGEDGGDDGGGVEPDDGAESVDNLLALSWQPAFCETRPGKTECAALNAGNLPVTETQLSIHGLWPQPEGNLYCGVPDALEALDKAARWQELPEPEIDAETREDLDVAMPGTASFLDRHEWIKHGTCFRDDRGADGYFDDTLAITAAINTSGVAQFLAGHVGAEVVTDDLRAAFDAAFGAGTGARVQVQCNGDGGRVLIQEIRIGLRGTIAEGRPLGALMLAADPVSPGCPRGVVDPAGLQ